MDCFETTSQTYPRLQDFQIINELVSVCGVLSKFAFDIRILQSFGEITESFSENQTGSSAMPTKRNPILSEKICSLAREISVYPKIIWDNYSLSLLERTLDDSANRRNIIPESFFICDEILISSEKLLNGMIHNEKVIKENLKKYLNYEGVLNEVVKRGGDRQNVYTLLNKNGYYNKKILKYITVEKIENILHNKHDIGIASIQAEKFVNHMEIELSGGGLSGPTGIQG